MLALLSCSIWLALGGCLTLAILASILRTQALPSPGQSGTAFRDFSTLFNRMPSNSMKQNNLTANINLKTNPSRTCRPLILLDRRTRKKPTETHQRRKEPATQIPAMPYLQSTGDIQLMNICCFFSEHYRQSRRNSALRLPDCRRGES